MVGSKAQSQEFDALFQEAALRERWTNKPDDFYAIITEKTHLGSMGIQARLRRDAARAAARKNVAKDIGVDPESLSTVKGKAEALPKLKQYLAQRAADAEKTTDSGFQEAAQQPRPKSETEKPYTLPIGAKFKYKGEDFEVIEHDVEAGIVRVKDGPTFKIKDLLAGQDFHVDKGTVEMPKAPAAKAGQELFESKEMPFNLSRETERYVEPTKTETAFGGETLTQNDLFAIREVTKDVDPFKSAKAARQMYGKDAIDRIQNQLRVMDIDPEVRRSFTKEQRKRLSEVLNVLRQEPPPPAPGAETGKPTPAKASEESIQRDIEVERDAASVAQAYHENKQKFTPGDIDRFLELLKSRKAPKPLLDYFGNLQDWFRLREKLKESESQAESKWKPKIMAAMRAAMKERRAPLSDPEVLKLRQSRASESADIKALFDDVTERFGGEGSPGYITSLYDLHSLPQSPSFSSVKNIGAWINELAADFQKSKGATPETGPVGEKGLGAAVPGEFQQPPTPKAMPRLTGWATKAKESLLALKDYLTPPKAGALPEIIIQPGAVLPRLPTPEVEKAIASSPQGMARVPGLGAAMDPRATAHKPEDAVPQARANSVAKGQTFRKMWETSQWQYQDLFKADEATGTIPLTNGKRGFISDVVEAELKNPGSQPITHAQWQWIHNEWLPLLKDGRKMLQEEGIKKIVTEDFEFDVANDYFPRPATGKRNRVVDRPGGKPGGRPGAKQFFQKSRKFPSEEEGARPPREGEQKEQIIYDPNAISRVGKWIEGLYRAVADHRMANDPALGAGTVPEQWGIGRRVNAGPAFQGKIYPEAIAKKIEKQYAQEVRGWVQHTADATSAAKALMATADMSAPFIQGAAMFGRNPVRWAKATSYGYRAMLDPNFTARMMEHPRYRELAEAWSQMGGPLLQRPEFLAGTETGQIATKIPGLGKVLKATGRGYTAFLDFAKLELFDAFRKGVPKSEWPRLVETIENSLFMGRMEQIGLNPHRAVGERLLAFAPSYYRGAMGLLSTAFQQGVSGKVARQMLGGYAAAGGLLTMAAYTAMGLSEDEIVQRLTPTRGKFMKIPVELADGKTIEVGFGNILTQLTRLAFQAADYHTSDKPIDTGVEANPYLRFLRGRAAFLPSMGIELATGRDYFGQRISAKESTVRHFMPFVLQSMFPRENISTQQKLGDSLFTFFGLNAYPESEYQAQMRDMDKFSFQANGVRFAQATPAQRARVVAQFKKRPDYVKREPTTTDMERIINLNEERRRELQESLGDEASEKLARMGLRLPGYKGTLRVNGQDVPLMEAERQRYQELLADEYRKIIGRMNESIILRRNQVDRDKAWSANAERAGEMARRRLMVELNRR